MILYISRIYFYSVTYMTLFLSLLYIKNIAHKYLRHLTSYNVSLLNKVAHLFYILLIIIYKYILHKTELA
jgi:hypothetical protein